ncbi:hypothetical protein SAMN04488066_102214 [Halorubrum aquaticum]|uniref:DUF7979 domain-containing protein n=1 Tax=Halorubrum aquaticum TaxID=387340 RepID=A0A1I2ZMM0_9EURY|nr:hypothetical protein [Halorubrum aquaticum]SFH38331.1 hypothetical protein SAMN04488066_102214 [Halorubrum aquaticum]
MSRHVSVAVLLALGGLLMANPLYLPVPIAEPTTAYAHAVQPVGPETPPYAEGDVVDRDELDADARDAFDRALESPDGGFTVEDPDERAESLSYPTGPTLGDGLIVVAHDGTRYEFWTRSVEREPREVVLQRLLVQPVGFLVGFLSVVAAVAVGVRDRN